MRVLRYIFCAFLCIGTAIADTISIDWIDGTNTYTQTTCEIGGDVILPPTPTKRGHTFVGWSSYTQLEYIGSTGSQYIDIEYVPTISSEIECKYWYNTVHATGGGQILFGVRGASSEGLMLSNFVASDVINASSTENNGYVRVGVYKDRGTVAIPQQAQVENIIKIDAMGYVYLNGLKINSSPAIRVTPPNISLNLFRSNTTTTAVPKDYAAGRIYWFRVLDNGILMRDMIPVKRNTDNVVGMYDTVSGQFFTNAGTGSFIAGPVSENQNFNE